MSCGLLLPASGAVPLIHARLLAPSAARQRRRPRGPPEGRRARPAGAARGGRPSRRSALFPIQKREPVACSVLGAIRFQQHRLDEECQLLQEAIRLEPRLVGAHLSLAQVYTLQGKHEPALPAVPPGPGAGRRRTSTARLALARVGDGEGKLRARRWSSPSRSSPRSRQSPDGLLVLATDLLKTGNRSRCGRARRGLAAPRRRSPGLVASASPQLLAESGLVAEAHRRPRARPRAGPPSYELAFALGGAHLVKGDPAGRSRPTTRPLRLKPDSLAALRQAAAVAERQGELERSLSYWMRAKKIAPDDPEILLGFGRVCLKMDLLDDAEPALTQGRGA